MDAIVADSPLAIHLAMSRSNCSARTWRVVSGSGFMASTFVPRLLDDTDERPDETATAPKRPPEPVLPKIERSEIEVPEFEPVPLPLPLPPKIERAQRARSRPRFLHARVVRLANASQYVTEGCSDAAVAAIVWALEAASGR